jgi:ABC-2 type transport system ATP-binding protein
MPPTEPAIETRSLSKRYGDVVAVDDLDLRVERGEVFGFLGPNGAGKSTTVDLLLDFVRPTAGTASVLGHDPAVDREVVHERIGVLAESYGLYDRLTGYGHLSLAADLKGTSHDPDALLDRVGLDPADAERPVGGYSKGMGQRLALALALVGEPELLILDEPTAGLDPNGARELREVIRAERDRGTTVFFSSHVLGQVEAVADRVGIMNRGRLVAVGPLDELRADRDGGARLTFEVGGGSTGPDAAGSGGGATAVDAGLADELRRSFADVPAVTDVRTADDRIELVCHEPAAKFEAIDRVRAATDVVDLRIEESSLEELFASYTDAASDGTDAASDGADGTDGTGPASEPDPDREPAPSEASP